MSERLMFINSDAAGRNEVYYCETEEDFKAIFDLDKCEFKGSGVYYIEEDQYHCGDNFYRAYKMPDIDILDMIHFAQKVKERLIAQGRDVDAEILKEIES